MEEDEEDAATAATELLRFLDELRIYESGSVFEKAQGRPKEEDFVAEIIQGGKAATRLLEVLRQYVRPRKEVLHIRRTVNAALSKEDFVGSGNVYSEHLEAHHKLSALK